MYVFRVVNLCEYANLLEGSDNLSNGISIERVTHFYRISADVSMTNSGY